MVNAVRAEIGGKQLIQHHVESAEEAAKLGLPKGIQNFWEYDGRRIYAPMEIINLVQNSVVNGSYTPGLMLKEENINAYHKQVFEAQRTKILEGIRMHKRYYETDPKIPEKAKAQLIQNMQHLEQLYGEHMPKIDKSGIVRPTRKQAEAHIGKDTIDKMIPKDIQLKLFEE